MPIWTASSTIKSAPSWTTPRRTALTQRPRRCSSRPFPMFARRLRGSGGGRCRRTSPKPRSSRCAASTRASRPPLSTAPPCWGRVLAAEVKRPDDAPRARRLAGTDCTLDRSGGIRAARHHPATWRATTVACSGGSCTKSIELRSTAAETSLAGPRAAWFGHRAPQRGVGSPAPEEAHPGDSRRATPGNLTGFTSARSAARRETGSRAPRCHKKLPPRRR